MTRGLTIVEVILAAFILLTGFIAIAAVFPLSSREARVNENRVQAVQIARNLLDAIRSHYQQKLDPKFLNPAPATLENSPSNNITVLQTVTVEGVPTSTRFYEQVTFASGSNPPNTPTDTATVTITWFEGGGVVIGNGGTAGAGNTTKRNQAVIVGSVGP